MAQPSTRCGPKPWRNTLAVPPEVRVFTHRHSLFLILERGRTRFRNLNGNQSRYAGLKVP